MEQERKLFRRSGVLLALLLMLVVLAAPAGGAVQASPTLDCSSVTDIPAAECEALQALYKATGGSSWTNNSGWFEEAQACTWYGIDCGPGDRIKSLSLSGNRLVGILPPELENFAKLELLDLAENQLSGSIPAQLGNLSKLEILWLNDNLLTGSLPPELGKLGKLIYLDLDNNLLTGAIPPQWGSLSKLLSLNLSLNQLTGAIPAEMGNLINLQNMNLSINRLTGGIPVQFGNLANLRWLNLKYNALSGPLPTSLTNIGSALLPGTGPTLQLEYNALYTMDTGLISFLEAHAPNFFTTQTAPPAGFTAVDSGANWVKLHWEPIPYTDHGGYYEIGYALSESGPYTVAGATADKTTSEFTVEGLSSGMLYFFRIRTFTPEHDVQHNDLWSDYAGPVSISTQTQTTPACAQVHDIPAADCEALEALYNSTGGRYWSNNTGWFNYPQACLWYGVSCTGSHVSALSLGGNQLSGMVPEELGNLTELRQLDLSSNNLTGPLPANLVNLGSNLPPDTPPVLNLVYNALYSNDATLTAFLAIHAPDFFETQTVAPDGFAVEDYGTSWAYLTWNPILYTEDNGYYEISYAEAEIGPYNIAGITADKTVDQFTARGLNPGSEYFFRIRTVTQPHDEQPNRLWSDFSEPLTWTLSSGDTIYLSLLFH